MADLKFKPVPHNHAEFIARAKLRPGFSEAYAALERAKKPTTLPSPKETENFQWVATGAFTDKQLKEFEDDAE
jgi:hypothetical protein